MSFHLNYRQIRKFLQIISDHFRITKNKIQEAIVLIHQAKELVDNAIKDSDNRHAKDHYEAYGKYGFDQLLGAGNPYDKSLEDLMNDFGSDGPYDSENADGTCKECGTKEDVANGCMLCDTCLDEYNEERI